MRILKNPPSIEITQKESDEIEIQMMWHTMAHNSEDMIHHTVL